MTKQYYNTPHIPWQQPCKFSTCHVVNNPTSHTQNFDTGTNTALINSPTELTQLFNSGRQSPCTSKPFCGIHYLVCSDGECHVEIMKYAFHTSGHLRLLDLPTAGLLARALIDVSS